MSGLIGRLITIRRRFRQLRPRRFVEGRRPDGSFGVLWLTPQATEMVEKDWNFPEARFLSYVLGPAEPAGEPVFVVLNAAPQPIEFTLPALPQYSRWTSVLNTTLAPDRTELHAAGAKAKAPPRSVLLFAGQA
jgi:glycogen operon protein